MADWKMLLVTRFKTQGAGEMAGSRLSKQASRSCANNLPSLRPRDASCHRPLHKFLSRQPTCSASQELYTTCCPSGTTMRRSSGRMGASLMLAMRLRIRPCSLNSQFCGAEEQKNASKIGPRAAILRVESMI